MEQVKEVLDNLNSALYLLQTETTNVKEKDKSLDAERIKIAEKGEKQEAKDVDLNARETAVAHIESIEKASADAEASLEESRQARANLESAKDEHEAKIKVDNQKIAEGKAKNEEDKIANKKQEDALIEEKKELEKQKDAFALKVRIAEEKK